MARTVIPLHPDPASAGGDLPDGPSRRRLLQLMAASAALATGACTRRPEEHIYPYVTMPEAGIGGLPVYYASAHVRDGYAHGVLIGTREGRPIKIEGNPRHPASGGATDVFAQASVLELWDTDRSQVVQQRLPGLAPTDAGESTAPPLSVQSVSTWDAFAGAWRAAAATLRARQGAGLWMVAGPTTSPTLLAQLTALQQAFPQARSVRHALLSGLAGGQALLHRFDRARLVLALGTDPFSHGPAALAQAGAWARRRAADLAAGHSPCRLVAVETAPGLFGARADERLALAPAGIAALLQRVAVRLFPDLGPAPVDDAATAAFETALAGQLHAVGGDALLIAGHDLPPATHALVHTLHQRLGAWGRTVQAIPSPEWPDAGASADISTTATATTADLARALRAGAVTSLLLLDANPVYDLPHAEGGGPDSLATSIARVPFSAHLGLYRDETSRACTWHLPQSHVYEAWGDACAFDGTATLLQPAIAPLYDTRSAIELLALLLDDPVRDGHGLVRRHWHDHPRRAGTDFETFWATSLRDGVVAGSAAAPDGAPVAATRTSPPSPAGPALVAMSDVAAGPIGEAAVAPPPLVAVFLPDASVADGRFANNGWLQELPRPFSKLTWNNAATLGPRTAAGLGLRTGDVVRITAGGDGAAADTANQYNAQQRQAAAAACTAPELEAPVWVEPLHAEGVVSLPLGYGRRHAGRVGDGIGFDAHVLRPPGGAPLPVALQPTGRRHAFAVTQQRMEQEGREIARSVPLAAPRLEQPPPRDSLYEIRSYPEHAWAMSIDLDACIGCNACTIACQAENNIPVVGAEQVAAGREMHWIRVDRYDDVGSHQTVFQPVPCMHCEDAPCEVVCPVGATMHDSEGLNVQVYNRCVGTRFCSNNCPYKVRRFNFFAYADDQTETLKAQRNPEVTVRRRGVMEKCTYCLQRVTRARLMAEKEGRALADGDVRTACQAACPTQAIRFGDLNLAGSAVSQSRSSPRHYAMLEELGTRPRTTYLAKVVDRPATPPQEPKA